MAITRKAMAAAALLFAIALLNPITAIGKANDRERPFRGFASGTITLNVVTGELEGDVSGSATHIGHYMMHVEGSGAFNPDSTFSGTGAFSVVTANGDEISGTMTFTTSPFTETGHTATIILTVEEGTGRFADASGVLRAFNQLTVLSFDGESLVQQAEITVTGRISY